MLTPGEITRYARHIVLKGFGAPGQQKLKQAKILVVGAGGLGSPVIAYLAAAGVGQLGIVDDDIVSLSNLQRQIIHGTKDISRQKTASGAEFARELNSEIEVLAICERITENNAEQIIAGFDLVVDGTDSFSSRATVAKACEAQKCTLVSGAVSMFDGQVSVFAPHMLDASANPAPSFSCLYPSIPSDDDLPSCEATGILGATTGVIGTLMAMEAIKLITDVGNPLIGRLLLYDGRDAKFTELKYTRRKAT